MPRRRSPLRPTRSEQMERLLGYPWPFHGRPTRHDYDSWTVVDNWPRPIPVSQKELDIFEAYFADELDQLFGPGR